jgi:hypothetical protein
MSAVISQAVGAPPKKSMIWAGRIVSALPVLMLIVSASMKLSQKPQVIEMFVSKLGYQESALVPLAVLELACALLYALPPTTVLGAVLVTGYLGGAVATHVRVGEPFFTPIVLGVLAWVGLYLRDPRVRALAPFKKVESSPS